MPLTIAVIASIACLLLYLRERRLRVRAEQSARETLLALRESQELARVGAWEYDIRSDGIRCSEETFHIFGLPAGGQEPDFADVLRAVHPEDVPVFDRAIQRAVTARESYRLDLRIRTRDGQQKFIHARGTPVIDENGDVVRIIGTVLDITDRKQAEQQLALEASHDVLTGLANRRYLMEHIHREMAVAQRLKSPLSICICDLDQFKSINDDFGHIAGDQLLAAFASLLNESTRSGDLVARLGGDEFCILLPRARSDQARICVERIRGRLEKTVFAAPDGRQFHATASFGIANVEPGIDAIGLIRAADEALYRAKRSGRNRVCGPSNDAETSSGGQLRPGDFCLYENRRDTVTNITTN